MWENTIFFNEFVGSSRGFSIHLERRLKTGNYNYSQIFRKTKLVTKKQLKHDKTF